MRNKQKYRKLRASVFALLLAVSMMTGMIPEGTGRVYAADTAIEKEEQQTGVLDKVKTFVSGLGDGISSFFRVNDEPTPMAAYDTELKADPSTLQTWKPLALDTTENIGRIWTDKTVSTEDMEFDAFADKVEKGTSQFLVALSALSSTSNMVTTSSKPLDIIMVLDVSGSMSGDLGTEYSYEETYDIRTGWSRDTYYAKNDNGEYVEIEAKTNWGFFDHWELNGKTVEPKESADDNTEGRIQFYIQKSVNVSKMQGLKNAVNSFAVATAKQNDGIQDETKRHNLSVVKFAGNSYDNYGDDASRGSNYTQRLNPLTAYDSSDISYLTTMVDNLSEGGSTAADYGLSMAKKELEEHSRNDAQKVVIFFTDGEPNHGNGFNSTVANDAITTAKELKAGDTLIYSIGVFQDADPGNTSSESSNRFNAYMHGVSSNYPNAVSWEELGERAADSNYYKAASNAEELNKIFTEIFDDVNTGSGFPTNITQGYEPNKGGYVTFDDQLGAYMQVDEFKSIIFADKKFDLNRDTGIKTEGNVTTYTFEGEGGNTLYPSGNLHDILITVTRSDDPATGDHAKVQIPASMIPLRHFKVDTDANGQSTMEIDEAWPIRIMYGASVKPDVVEMLEAGLGENAADETLKAYLNENRIMIGNNAAALFYSNVYTGEEWQGHQGQTLGNTVASFEPAKGNNFYYFTKDTPIFTDENFEHPVTDKPVSGDIYYYKKTFWTLESGKPVEKTIALPFASDNFEQASANWALNEQNELYIKAGSARLTRVDSLTLSKEKNVTNTATEVINPQWDNVNNPYTLHVYLGNNGSIAVEVPGALEIKKDATVAAGKNLNEDQIVKDKKFAFKVAIPDMKNQTVKAEKRNQQGEIQGEVFDLTFDKDGNVTEKIELKDNECLYIHGLDAGVSYTVTEDETAMPKGFTLTSVVTDGKEAKATEAAGTITGGESKKHTFVNTYDVEAVDTTEFAPFKKEFDRWDLAESFDMMLTPDDRTYPMPEGSKDGQKIVRVTEEKQTGDFGTITFTAPGTYGYTVSEKVEENDRVAGVTYSRALYDVQVIVSDQGNGALKVDSVIMKQTGRDNGVLIPESEQQPVETAVFVNTFHADNVSHAAYVRKTYNDTTGGSIQNGKFWFKMKPRKDLDEGETAAVHRPQLPEGANPDPADESIVVSNTGFYANFEAAVYDADCIGNTYAYELTEVVPAEVTADSPTLNGMTYDLNRYLVKMKVTKAEDSQGNAQVLVTPAYYKIVTGGDGSEGLEELTDKEGRLQIPDFTNTYDPQDLILPGEGRRAIQGSKTLVGRNSLKEEAFSFTLSAANEAASTALANDWIVFEEDKEKTEMEAVVTELTDRTEKAFDFGKVQFTRPGIYQFNVVENAPENGKGMVYDRHTAVVTVTVTDNQGILEGNVTYDNGENASVDRAAFVNTYTASAIYGDGAALNLSKTLNGRDQKVGEFSFQIDGKGEEAAAKLKEEDRQFDTIASSRDGVPSVIFNKLSGVKFTEADAGKTFSYIVREVLPQDDDTEKAGVQKQGVTYTQMQYQADIAVRDNGDGTMSTVTTVSRTHNDAGEALEAPEVLGTYDSADGKDTSSDISFVNSYAAKSVTVDTDTDENVRLTKQLKGRSWKTTDAFSFTWKALNPTDAPLPVKDGQQTTTVEVTQQEGTADSTVVPFGFGTVTFDKPGTYYYQVTEEHAGKTIKGITYDSQPATLQVRVEDSGEGQLTASAVVWNRDFVNTYTADLNHNAAGGIVTAKTLTGRDMEDRQFTFQVKALEGIGTTADENAKRIGIKEGIVGSYRNDGAANADETLTMKTKDSEAIQFTTEDIGKTLVYQFSEMGADGKFGTGGTKDGYTYDDSVYTVELSVSDDGDGTLTLHTKVTDQDGGVTERNSDELNPVETYLPFVNSYTPESVTIEPGTFAGNVTKVLKGNRGTELQEGEFTFQMNITAAEGSSMDHVVLPEGQQPVTAANNADGSVRFGEIRFKAAGRYHVAISEVIPAEGSDSNMTYDGHTFAYDIAVTYNSKKGELTAETVPESVSGDPEFTNVYETENGKDVVIGTGDAQTSVNGKMVGVGDQLTYTIDWVNRAVDENGQPAKASVTVTDKVPSGTRFVSAENKGAYDEKSNTVTWNLGEQKPGASGTVVFTVEVTEDGAAAGTVENTASITIGENDPKTTNTTTTYVPGKTVTNDNSESTSIQVGDTVTYKIKYYNTESAPATVIIRDRIPESTDYVKGSAGDTAVYDAENRTLTWTLQRVEPNTSGEVTFKAVVNENAIKGKVDNKATVQIGENGPEVNTNTETFETKTGDIMVSKEVQVTEDQGTEINRNQKFVFAVKLTDRSGKELSGTYRYQITGEADSKELTSGTEIELKHDQSAEIKGLPEGTVCTVKETAVSGYTPQDGAEKSAEVVRDQKTKIEFINLYNAAAGELAEGTLHVKKILSGRDWNETDIFAVQLEAKGGSNAAGETLAASEVPMPEGEDENRITVDLTKEKQEGNFGTISYSKTGTYQYTITELQPEEGAIEGITYSEASYDVTVTVTDQGDGTLKAAVQGNSEPFVFTNTYEASMPEEDKTGTNAVFTKALDGRGWTESDSFKFCLSAVTEGAPLPKDAEGNDVTQTTVTAADVKDGKAEFSFGTIMYTLDMVKDEPDRTKEFVYEVTEAVPGEGETGIAGMTYDTHKATMKITVSDDGKGKLRAVTTLENDTFTNVYQSKLDYNSAGGLQISKTLNGRDMQADQFTFTVTPKETAGSTTAKEAAQKLGLQTGAENVFTNAAAPAGTAAITNILAGKSVVFTQADAGKIYTYEIAEKAGENPAYSYDSESAVVTIEVADNQDATLTVTTAVTKGGQEVDRQVVTTGAEEPAPAVIPFVNAYNGQPGYLGGSGNVSIQAGKTLTNRPLEAGEFTFNVLDKTDAVVTSGVNDAAGNITFETVKYTTDKLNKDAAAGIAVREYDAETDSYLYSYAYKVVEDMTNAGEGVSGITTELAVTVTVTDNGDGTLDVQVKYPEGTEGLMFENAYGAGAEAELSVNGQKILNVESGDNAPDITGKYEFVLEGSEGAPMPEKTTTVNDAAGNVSFGKIRYTMENVFGEEAQVSVSEVRTKNFTYTVRESGSVDGVANDTDKTFVVTVTDNGDGTLSVSKEYENFAFIFTNTYSVAETEYSISTDLAVSKTLDGRKMNAGEFVFELISDTDNSVCEAVNDENGRVVFKSMVYTAPGEYIYTLREKNTGLNGITYDAREYRVVVTVTDNGNGTLSAAAIVDGEKEIVFENSYKPAPTTAVPGASKMLKDGDLKDGQFTFLLKDEDGKVIDEAVNNRDGQIAFKSIKFEKAGTYRYTITEKNDKQKNIVYDQTEYGVTIEVTDDAAGHLSAVIHYEKDVPPTFTNKYVRPEEPKPSEPDTPDTVRTGDKAPVTGLAVMMAAALAAMLTAATCLKKRRK